MSKLTVVTTTYNHEDFIKQALDGIVSQKTNFDFELLICDDNSTDDTAKIIKEYQKKYPEIVKPIFNKKNLGAMENFIFTLSKAKSEYVALCDGDDFWSDCNKLQKQVDFLDNNKDFSIVFHQTKIFYEDNSKNSEIYPNFEKTVFDFHDLVKDSFIPANTVVYRWEFNKKNLEKEFPKNVVPGDYLIHLFHAKKGKIKFLPEIMSSYRRHDKGMWWTTSDISKKDEFNLKYGKKYLNFFLSVEKIFELSSNTYSLQKDYLTNNLLEIYLKKKMFDEIVEFKKEYKDLYEKCIVNFNYFEIYNDLSKSKKAIYLLFFNKEKFLNKLSEKYNKIFRRKK